MEREAKRKEALFPRKNPLDKSTLRQANEFDINKPHTTCVKCGGIYNLKQIGNLSYYICIYCGTSYNP